MNNIKILLNANKAVYKSVANLKLVGLTELELKDVILKKYKELLGEFSFEGDIVAGVNSAIGEGAGSDYVIKKGDAIILDLLPGKNQRYCDTTRTFFVGSVSQEQKAVYQTVKRALVETAKIIKAGIRAKDIYAYTYELLKPYENTFFHHAGHLVGGERLIQPQFLPGREERLKAGDIITLEPGIYVKGKFGVRLENNYLVLDDGCDNLFNHTLDIENFITRS